MRTFFSLVVCVLLATACGSTEEAAAAPYLLVDSWPVENGGVHDFSGGLTLAANSQTLVCAALIIGSDDQLQLYSHETGFIRLFQDFFSTKPDQPISLSFSGQFLYLGDKNNRRFVRKAIIPPEGAETVIRTHASYLAHGLASNETHHFLLWFNGSGDDLLEKTTLAGALVTSAVLSGDDDGGQALAVDAAGDLYIATILPGGVRKYRGSDLGFVTVFGTTELSMPVDLAVSAADEVLVINGGRTIAVFDTTGRFLGSFGQFASALGIATHGEYVWVADWNNGAERIYRFRRNGS